MEISKQAKKDCYPWKVDIIHAAKRYIKANHAVRQNPCGWKSCHGPIDDPIWAEYYKLQDKYDEAYAELLLACDVEFSDDEIANAAWHWKYWKVMARKCCYYQKSIFTEHMAGKTMRNLNDAEIKLIGACGLSELYKPSSYYFEKVFPNLKSTK